MIISLFMDRTPLICGSGHNLGAHANVGQAKRLAGALARRGDDQDDHQKHAEGFHVSASRKMAGLETSRLTCVARLPGLSW
jgi:hypothetical protein